MPLTTILFVVHATQSEDRGPVQVVQF